MIGKWEDTIKPQRDIHLRSTAGESTTLAILDSNLEEKQYCITMSIHISDSVDVSLMECQETILQMLLPKLRAEVAALEAEARDEG